MAMMISVKIGMFRNHLSRYLQKVRRGAEVVISDRETPIGRLLPFDRKKFEDKLDLIDPPKGFGGLSTLRFPPCHPPVSASEILLEERRAR